MSEPALTRKQRELLERLERAPIGALPAEDLDHGEKRVAAALQRAGLARWRAELGATRHSLRNQWLHIAAPGLEIVWASRRQVEGDR